MNLGFFGLFDIIIVVLGLLSIIIGYKVGFMKKLVSLFGILIVIGLSIMLAPTLAELLKKWDIIYPSIYNDVYDSVLNEVNQAGPDASVEDIIKASLGFLSIFSFLIVKHVNVESTAELPDYVATKAGTYAMRIISFGILVVFFIILIIILHFIIKKARTNIIVRRIDGIFGMLLGFASFILTLSFIMFILKLCVDNSVITGGALDFIKKDMMLDSDAFRLSKYIYNANIFVSIKELF